MRLMHKHRHKLANPRVVPNHNDTLSIASGKRIPNAFRRGVIECFVKLRLEPKSAQAMFRRLARTLGG